MIDVALHAVELWCRLLSASAAVRQTHPSSMFPCQFISLGFIIFSGCDHSTSNSRLSRAVFSDAVQRSIWRIFLGDTKIASNPNLTSMYITNTRIQQDMAEYLSAKARRRYGAELAIFR